MTMNQTFGVKRLLKRNIHKLVLLLPLHSLIKTNLHYTCVHQQYLPTYPLLENLKDGWFRRLES